MTVVEMILAALAAGAVGALGSELVLRSVFRRRRYYVWAPRENFEFDPDPETHPYAEKLVRWNINAEGERGGEVPPPEGLYRVLCVGGSAVECYLLDQPTSWPGALEVILAEPDRRRLLGAQSVHVGAIGLSGVDSRSLDYILERVLPNYDQLDLILIMVGASDVLRWLEIGAPVDKGAEPMPLRECCARHPELDFGWAPRKLALAEAARFLRNLRKRRNHRVAKWFKRARTMRAGAKDWRDEVADPTVMLETFDRHLRSAVERCRAKSKRVMVLRQPGFEKSKYTAEEEALLWSGGAGKAYGKGTVSTYYTNRLLFELMRALDERTVRICKELGVEQCDIQSNLPPTLENYFDHFHFTPAGSLRTAHLVADAIAPTSTSIAPTRATAAAQADSRR